MSTSDTIKRDTWKARNPERNKAINDERNARVRADPVLWAKKLEANRISYKKTRAKRARYDRARDRVKENARCMIRNRIRRGKLIRGSCVVCGQSNAQAHHEDYSKPLDIIWLCPAHHKQLHK